jgi:uncharacterized integral membrane protein
MFSDIWDTVQLLIINIFIITNEDEENINYFYIYLKNEAVKTKKKAI